jgi:septum site-determining protein MinC
MSDLIAIRGSREGLRLQLNSVSAWHDVLQQLEQQLAERRSFFHGARLVVDVGERELAADEIAEMLTLMQRHGIEAEALDASRRKTRTAIRAAGMVAWSPQRHAGSEAAEPLEQPIVNGPSFLQRTIRSGQVIQHAGNVTLVGDVNPGAQLLAGGSIVIFGRVRGLVHAGVAGDRSAQICALELLTSQVRIADAVLAMQPTDSINGPAVARIQGDQIEMLSWEAIKR